MVKRLLVPTFILILVYIVGIYWFNILEGWNYFDAAFYITMAITSVAAYGDMFPNSESGKMLLIIISLLGVANMLYIFAILADIMTRHDDRNREIIKGMLLQMNEKKVEPK